MRFAERGVIWSIAAPTLALTAILLTTIGVAARAIVNLQREGDQAIDQALSAAAAAERLEEVFQECRGHLGDYAITGRPIEIEQARRSGSENAERLLEIDRLYISDRGHMLIAELRRYSVALQGALDKIPVSAAVATRDAAVEKVIATLLDPQILSRAREERELCLESLRAVQAQRRRHEPRRLDAAGAGPFRRGGRNVGRIWNRTQFTAAADRIERADSDGDRVAGRGRRPCSGRLDRQSRGA